MSDSRREGDPPPEGPGMMRKALFTAFLLIMGATSALADDQDFLLLNRTGAELRDLRVAPVETEEWSEDLLRTQTVATGQDRLVMFDTENQAPKWNVRAQDEKGNKLEWREVDLITATTLVLEPDGKSRIR
ncbi:MAG: hypothetical protein AMXMBFR33_60970 [Candidatus Xenobia bacterium]